MKIFTNFRIKTALCQFKAIVESFPVKNFSTSAQEIQNKSNKLFSDEQKRQFENVGRIEKIKVKILGPTEEVELIMNQNISTPHDCAKHLSEAVVRRSALAQVDDNYWDMHSPLPGDCSLRFLTFRDAEPHFLNRAFWRSCSVMLGSIIVKSFKDNIPVHLHSFPSPNVRSGSFVYDVELGLADWKPTKDELRVLSAEMSVLSHAALPFEKLVVEKDLACEIFETNPYKVEQIPSIASKSADGKVTLYRIGNHIDISRGPLIADSSFLGRCTITAVHKLVSGNGLYRFQGVALPKSLMLNHFAFGILEERAQKLNVARLPHEEYEAVAVQ